MKKFALTLILLAAAYSSIAGGAAETNSPPTFADVKEQALKGDAKAQFDLGARYLAGSGVDRDTNEAFNWIQKAADQNFTRAQFVLASAYIKGDGRPKDPMEGIMWLRRAAERGMLAAQYELGAFYYEGKVIAQDFDEAVKWFQAAADQGDAPAQHVLGVCYINGQGVKQDPVEAFKWLKLAAESGEEGADKDLDKLMVALSAEQIADGNRRASTFVAKKSTDDSPSFADPGKSAPSRWGEVTIGKAPPETAKPAFVATDTPLDQLKTAAGKGDARAQVELGVRYRRGYGVPANFAEAENWFVKAAEQGEREGRLQLALLSIEGTNLVRKVQGLKATKQMAEQHYVRAETALGLIYESDYPFDKDEAEGIRWLRRAALEDEPLAVFVLGASYLLGTNGTGKDSAEAVKWLRKSSEQDSGAAQFMLGTELTLPTHTPEEQAEGVKWLRASAEQGITMSQVALAGCYQFGRGTAKDLVEAFKWYKIAGAQASEGPGIPRELLDELSPAELAEGAKRAAGFKPRKSRLATLFLAEPPGLPNIK